MRETSQARSGEGLLAACLGLFVLAIPLGNVGAGILPGFLSPTKAAFYVLLVVFVGRFGFDAFRVTRTSDWWAVVLLAGGALSILPSVLPRVSAVHWFRLAAMVGLFLIARAALAGPRAARSVGAALVLAGTAVAALGVFQTLTSRTVAGLGLYPPYQSLVPVESLDDPERALIFRAAGTFSHPNELGMFLVGCLPITLGMAWMCRRGWVRAVFLVSAGLQVIAALYTFSRSAWMGVVVAVGVWTAFHRGSRRIAPAVCAAALLLGVAVLPPGGRLALLARGAGGRAYGVGRVEYFGAALRMTADSPLMGTGLGTFAERFGSYRPPGKAPDPEQSGDAHNAFLSVAAEAGIPAGAALVYGVLAALLGALRRTRQGRDNAPWTPAACSALAGMLPLM
ncbi:O-antigen ligase family protein, partial [Verrucomicrobiota bacterium]